jgi:nucleoside-diphosphate-sugar epimerase
MPPLAHLVDALKRLGVSLPIDKARVLFSKEFIYYDNRKASIQLGMTFRPFEESVQAAYDWYVENDYLQQRGVKPHA